ncbi:unnamed protein product [Paramecium pentaurelia]|uniref:Nudix hydrolase domain-containing protein n=2 Tax=Paramecium pentaurelia TaxID=43138 RepID=A0A8S1TQ63_9CILI|nr:unnamed protein product [Paramecium pentaurelia]
MKIIRSIIYNFSQNLHNTKNFRSQALLGNEDVYQCYHIQKGKYLDSFTQDLELFTKNLIQTINDCKSKQMKAIWIQLDQCQLTLAEKLIEQGFYMHHCTQNYLLFSQWIVEDEKNQLPNYTTHSIGAGGLILHNNQILLIQEKNGLYKDEWTIPGGLVNDEELIIEAAIREVKEEAGLDVEPYDCFLIRDLPIANQYQADLYFVILMRLQNNNQSIKIQEQEIKNFKWVELNELQEFYQNNKFGMVQSRLMESLIQFNKSNKFDHQFISLDAQPKEMYGQIKKYCLFKPKKQLGI